MPDCGGPFTIRVVDPIPEIPAAAWDACAGPDNPFLSHAFLDALEESGSATAATGWLPQHLALEDEGGRLLGAAPLYLKGHSYGEYVFDHGWADAYERAGGRYYPKLQCAVPFTPVTGPRLLIPGDAGAEAGGGIPGALIAGMRGLAPRHQGSSLPLTLPPPSDWGRLPAPVFLQRYG